MFAIRDFLVTPLMIRQRFRLPTDGFEFPPFEDRYRVSGEDGGRQPPGGAALPRGSGLLCRGVRVRQAAYAASSFSTALSVVCAVVGLLLGFVLTLTTGLPPTSGQLLTYLLLWLVPPALVSLGLPGPRRLTPRGHKTGKKSAPPRLGEGRFGSA